MLHVGWWKKKKMCIEGKIRRHTSHMWLYYTIVNRRKYTVIHPGVIDVSIISVPRHHGNEIGDKRRNTAFHYDRIAFDHRLFVYVHFVILTHGWRYTTQMKNKKTKKEFSSSWSLVGGARDKKKTGFSRKPAAREEIVPEYTDRTDQSFALRKKIFTRLSVCRQSVSAARADEPTG